MRLIDADAMKEDLMIKVLGARECDIDKQPTIKAVPIEVLEELRSDCLRIKHNTGNIDTVIDELDRKISEVRNESR